MPRGPGAPEAHRAARCPLGPAADGARRWPVAPPFSAQSSTRVPGPARRRWALPVKSPLWGPPHPLSQGECTTPGSPGGRGRGCPPPSQQSVTPGYTSFHLQPLATPSLTSLSPLAVGTAWVPTGTHGAVARGGDHRWATQGHLGKLTRVTRGPKVGREEAPAPSGSAQVPLRPTVALMCGQSWSDPRACP